MQAKKVLALICGGKSAEHEISLCSAWNFLQNINRSAVEIMLIGISKNGDWALYKVDDLLSQQPNTNKIALPNSGEDILLQPGAKAGKFFNVKTQAFLPKMDVVFPLLHGPNGEDGTIQGLLDLMDMPYIGPRQLGAAICMDKDVAKRLMLQAGIATSSFLTSLRSERHTLIYEDVVDALGLPLFVKPANMGSSVGINKVIDQETFEQAIDEAFEHDNKIIIEEFVEGKEVELAVLGNETYHVSTAGTYAYADDFFAYDTKYLKEGEVVMEVPAKMLDEDQVKELKTLALRTYKVLECKGMARVDIFVTPSGEFMVNEVNTIPGFTQYSMYPLLMEDAGINYNSLIAELITLAEEAHQNRH